MTSEETRCGSYAGYQRHIRRKEPTCEPCRKANAVYVAEFRADNPESYALNKRRDAARNRALWRLANAHRTEFDALVIEELGPPQRRAG